MSKKLAALVLALSFLLVRPAEASISMARADGTTSWSSGGATITYPISNCDSVRVQVWSTAGSTAVVNVELQSSATAPWYPVAVITNPTATGEYWSIPRGINVRVNVVTANYVSGTILANLEGYNRNERIY